MNGSRILIVEDEQPLLRGLADTFTARGCEVLTAADGEAGLRLALSSQPDLVLLDIMLPKVNGYEICRAMREQAMDTPVIMLTAKGHEEDVVLGLNLGADDYVSKPFRRQELVARVNALLRRHRGAGQSVHRFGPYTLDLASHKLFRDSEPRPSGSVPPHAETRPSGSVPPQADVELTPSEFKLLEHFVRNRGRALTRRDILNAVWGNDVFVTPRSIDRCVTTLRAKIEADPHNPVFVRTVRDVGYRFEN